jgi:hypothetical protein
MRSRCFVAADGDVSEASAAGAGPPAGAGVIVDSSEVSGAAACLDRVSEQTRKPRLRRTIDHRIPELTTSWIQAGTSASSWAVSCPSKGKLGD